MNKITLIQMQMHICAIIERLLLESKKIEIVKLKAYLLEDIIDYDRFYSSIMNRRN